MKIRLVILALLSSYLQAIDLPSRFGPNSPVYNEPLYFSDQKMIARPKKETIKRSYRKIKKKCKNSKRDKKTSLE